MPYGQQLFVTAKVGLAKEKPLYRAYEERRACERGLAHNTGVMTFMSPLCIEYMTFPLCTRTNTKDAYLLQLSAGRFKTGQLWGGVAIEHSYHL